MEQINEEIWKDITGYEGKYQVSSLGRIKSLLRFDSNNRRTVKEVIRKPFVAGKGYYYTSLHSEGRQKMFGIHRLVAIEFIPNPDKHKEVNHIDRNKQNNVVNNLEWCSSRENNTHKHTFKTSKFVGVSWSNAHKKWISGIFYNKKRISLGFFDDEIEASKAYLEFIKNNKIKNRYAAG